MLPRRAELGYGGNRQAEPDLPWSSSTGSAPTLASWSFVIASTRATNVASASAGPSAARAVIKLIPRRTAQARGLGGRQLDHFAGRQVSAGPNGRPGSRM
jgi:hypothetical protein